MVVQLEQLQLIGDLMTSDLLRMISSDLEVYDELFLIVCSILGWLLFSGFGRWLDSRRVRLSLDAKLTGREEESDSAEYGWKDSKLEEGWLVMARRSFLAAAMKHYAKSPRTQKSLKSLRRVSFCEEVNVRACPARECSEWERRMAALDAYENSLSEKGQPMITPEDYKEMVRKTIRPALLLSA